ncbi:RNase A-like domain-containing protein [Burkholderia ubonensis]|uniref:RNase A-like domain-containing protein n=1 Tax=Burkholderia ubonensis TaxID=101571 RepID=UPI0026D14AD4|nr:RNase A-like domain-containing protein [Burkholderia ubonensis]
MAGAAALCVAPEPTGLTKLGCVAFGVHGADTAAAALNQVWTARDTSALLQQGVSKLVGAANAPPEMADHVGLSLDIAVPFALAGAVKAIRASSIVAGRIDLMQHEARATNPGLGGHTIAKHVGKSEAYLRSRLKAEPKKDFVSSFSNLAEAEWAISNVMQKNATKIGVWAQSASKGPLVLNESVGRSVGYGLSRENGIVGNLSHVQVVLKLREYNGMPFYIISSYLTK